MKNIITKKELTRITDLCTKYNIKNYHINPDGTLDVDGHVKMWQDELTELPLSFNIVTGNFTVNNNKLTTLKGCPREVGKNFGCNKSKLTTLEFGPEKVGGYYNCPANKLTDLEHIASYIGGNLNCINNKLTSLKGLKHVGGGISCSGNKLTSLEGCPEILNGDLNVYGNNNLTNLQYCPKRLYGQFRCGETPLNTLRYYPEVFGEVSPDFIHSDLPRKFKFMFRELLNSDEKNIFLKYQNHYGVWDNNSYDEEMADNLVLDIKEGLE